MADYDAAESAAPASAERQKDFGLGDRGIVARWLTEISLYDTEFKTWVNRCERIIKRYRDERSDTDTSRKVNVLWSNIQTLQPAIYARPPTPDVQRRWKDADPIGRVASQVLERALSYTIDTGDLDGTLKLARDDYLLTGRAQAWVRYEFEAGEPTIAEDGTEVPTVANERAVVDYIYWQDFGHTPARVWSEVRAVWRRVYLTRDDLIDELGEELGNKIPLDTEPAKLSDEQRKNYGAVFKTACCYEIWDKESRQTLWIAKSYPDAPLKSGPPPLDLNGFFPCPEPFYGCLTTDSLIPLPDYCQYQDQAIELDELTERISLLTTAIRVAGVYDGSIKDKLGQLLPLNDLLSPGTGNKLVPVDSWAAFAERGGLKGAIDWLPLDQIVNALNQLYLARQQVKQDLLEVTGLSDIVRGQGNPNETATAQQIKGRFASMRLTDRQNGMARFARDIIRLCAEVIAEQFSVDTLRDMTGVKLPLTRLEANPPPPMPMMGMAGPGMPPPQGMGAPQPPGMPVGPQGIAGPPMSMPGAQATPPQPPVEKPSWEAVLELLRDDLQRGFRIDIETDSTIALDEDQQKKDATELLNVAAPFFQQVAAAPPPMLPLMAETFMQVIRRFKLGRNIEQTFEETLAQLQAMAKQPRPDPNAQALQLEAEKAKQTIAIKQAEAQADQQLDKQKAAATLQLEQHKAAAQLELRKAELQADTTLKMEQMKLDHVLKQDEAAMTYDLKASGQIMDTKLKAAKGQATHPVPPAGQPGAQPAAPRSNAGQQAQAIGTKLDGLADAIQQLVAITGASVQAQQATAQALALPKPEPAKQIRVLRGRDGRVTGASVSTAVN